MIEKWQKLRASGLAVFDRRTVANILGVAYASTNPILDRLVRRGVLVRLRRDHYVLAQQERDQTRKIANELVKPSAISLWTALSDAGCTTQVPRIVQSVTPQRSATIESEKGASFQYVHLPERLYFGYQIQSGIWTAPPEKALLDLLYIQRGTIDWDSIDRNAFTKRNMLSLAKVYPRFVRTALSDFFPLQP